MGNMGGQSALTAEPSSHEYSKTNTFRKKYFPNLKDIDWNNWTWQICHRYATKKDIEHILKLSNNESSAIDALESLGKLTVNITPYYLSLISETDPNQPLRRTVIPTMAELDVSYGESVDPLHEDCDSPIPKLVHRYDDRVLLLVSGSCSSYCRYCTRSRFVGVQHNNITTDNELERAIEYIENTDCIRDVLLSGGDPLLLSDMKLNYILNRLRNISHVEIIRIGTKVPVVLPQRITTELCNILKHYHPVFMSIHFTHVDECTDECKIACEKLADSGIPLGSQTVLLSGINDNINAIKQLMHRLLTMRVKPYYLYQCDPVIGTSQFRTPISKGLEIIDGLRGHTSGYAVPTFVIDAPGGGGKIPLQPNYVVGHDTENIILRNFRGELCRYPG
jgi:lysine 2,3-aminomutase